MDYIWTGLAAILAYAIYGAVWRLYFSPIAHFPGPPLAALTSLYEAYYNIWCGGKYIFKIDELHKQYGPVVRISPVDLHVGDPEFFEALYPSSTSGRKANKDGTSTKFLGIDESLFTTMDHNVHRMRRAALLPFFSTAYVRKMQPDFQERINVLLRRISAFMDTDEPLNANCIFAAFSNDMVHLLAFGECHHKLEAPDFDSTERDASISGAMSVHIMKRVPWLNNVMMALPESLVKTLSPTLGSFSRQKRRTREQVAHAISTKDQGSETDFQPVFRGLSISSKLPPYEKTVDRLAQDAQMLLMAGTLTMASTLEHMIYWISDSPDVLRKLKEELKTVMPSIDDVGTVSLATLEILPYMTAIIKESVRLIYGNSWPHFRVCPDQPLFLEDKTRGKSWTIPPGTSVGMTSVLLHHNETNFPNSSKFDPDRWLGEDGKKLEKYQVGFGKGGRMCLGMHQAFGMARLVLSQIWRLYASPDVRIGDEVGVLSLYNTSPYDVEMNGDFFIASYNKAQGVEFKLNSLNQVYE